MAEGYMVLKQKFFLIAVLILFTFSCGKDYSAFVGNYEFVKKIDEANKEETIYKDGSNRFKHGYKIQAADTGLSAIPVKFETGGGVKPVSHQNTLALQQTDEEVFQFKKPDGSLVLTFGFSDHELLIMEFTRDNHGNLKQQSTLELKKR